MTFIFEPARSLLITAGVLVIAGILLLMRTNRSPARRFIGLVICIALTGTLLLRYRTRELIVDESGITADTYGRPAILWPDVAEAAYIPVLSASRYMPRPTLKSSFRVIGFARARYGWFDSASGERALFALQRYDGDAVIVTTSDTAYVFAPSDVHGLAEAIAAHVPVSGLDAER